MNSLRTVFASLLVISLSVMVGCEWNNPWQKDSAKSDGPKTAESQTVAAKASDSQTFTGNGESNQGNFIRVRIDGNWTRKQALEENEQIWATPSACTPTPVLTYTIDETALGALKQPANVTLYPLKNGKLDWTDVYTFVGEKLLPAQEVKLNSFTHVHDGQMDQSITTLPAGKYRLSIQVLGEKNWDRQRIDLEVK